MSLRGLTRRRDYDPARTQQVSEMEAAAQNLAVATVWMAAACFGAGPKPGVVIFDYAETPGATLEAAAGVAREAFRALHPIAGENSPFGALCSNPGSFRMPVTRPRSAAMTKRDI